MWPQPVRVCQQLYGVQNVNEVRDAVVECYRRFLGATTEWRNPAIYAAIQRDMAQILSDAGRNPRAVRLALPPDRLTANPFPQYFIETGGDKNRAYEYAMRRVLDTFPSSQVKQALLNIYIDYHAC